ncbi:MAG: hypothetical protein ONB49_11030 [candidate division KSB1 bacterium]|nr:hypothetical protein [candidate division KSB1 bacterium]MDZ7354582.1 hypothetical protein [candidate division KSB1 bacterium]
MKVKSHKKSFFVGEARRFVRNCRENTFVVDPSGSEGTTAKARFHPDGCRVWHGNSSAMSRGITGLNQNEAALQEWSR